MSAIGMQLGEHAAAMPEPLPAPKPARLHWSTLFSAVGLGACAAAIVLALLGVPASLGFDESAPNKPIEVTSNDPLKIMRGLNSNMGWMAENSLDAPGKYVGLIKSINQNEAEIAPMGEAITALSASLAAVEANLSKVYGSVQTTGDDMDALYAAANQSAGTMGGIKSDVGELNSTMSSMAQSTVVLTVQMERIARIANQIANEGTATALESTRDMNSALPDQLTEPQLVEGGQ